MSQFANRLASTREDYPDAAYFSLMNLLDSHDTERLRWTLTPGAETTAGREQTASNVAAGKLRVKLASLIQFTVPGAPTIYYGDEVGMTGDDDPDDRRTYPWADTGGTPDTAMLAHYTALASMRDKVKALTDGDFRILAANDAAQTVAYGRRSVDSTAIVVLNRSDVQRTVSIPVAGYLPDGISLARRFGVGNPATGSVAVADGAVHVTLAPMSGLVLATDKPVDLKPPTAPTGLRVTSEGDGTLSIAWDAVSGAAAYDVWVSPLSGGGYVKANDAAVSRGASRSLASRTPGARTSSSAPVTQRGTPALPRTRSSALPHLTVGWANLQWPPTMTHTIWAVNRTDNAYGQVWIDGVHEPARPDAGADRPARLRTGRIGPRREPRLVMGHGPVQHRRRQQRRVRRVASARRDGGFRLRLPLHRHRRSGLDLRRPRRHRQRLLRRPGRLADRQPEQRHVLAGGSRPPPRRVRPRRQASSLPGTRLPATPPSTATKSVGARPVGGRTRRSRRPRTRPSPTPPSLRARPTSTWSARWTNPSIARARLRRSRRRPSYGR